jgi:hypothetical protein
MQFQIHGTGTALYGRRDYLLDRSFVTTEWVTIGYLPIVPLISKRISFTRLDPFHARDISGHYIVAVLPLNKKQVWSVYAWVASLVTWFIIAAYFKETLTRRIGDDDKTAGWLLGFLAAILAAPYLLRRLAAWRASRGVNRASYGLGPRSID